ncbi:hypothetical protein X777_13796 [Ooceraea biroi]|uniref:GIY-YIG domain-containing protein n=1 Tax=Ooceraea biroi TaxID=2015173 RepID=A0A026VXC9_OOCBI|nr:hypothetical protein X777_13796 [Ooceraea biroi]
MGDPKIKTAFFSLNKLERIIKPLKDVLPVNVRTDVVYELSCMNCNATYVGKTSRQLKIRISEHKNHIRRNTDTHSVITEHRLALNHEFNWENVRILDNEVFGEKVNFRNDVHKITKKWT